MENIRKAVRVFAFKDEKVLCIKYKKENKDYYDIPGGKIEDNENEIDACKREFEEETGMKIDKLKKIGIFKISYPHINKMFVMNTYVGEEVKGEPKESAENFTYWLSKDELIQQEKRFAITHLLDKELKYVFEEENSQLTFICDKEHNIEKIIRGGKNMTNWEELQWRGLVKDVAGEDIADKINNESITFYWGTDPTADSLHIGHYSSLVTAKRLMLMGHKPILLCGGATGRIGDPRPTAEREIISIEELNKNIEGIRNQIDKIFAGKAKLVNNYDWFKGYEFLDFLRDVGKYINVNYMLSKDIIDRRLETGITYAEFSYMLIQGYDFLHMYRDMNCIMQVEGSDQWGNITTGIDLIKKIEGKEAYAFTMPLILDASGNKFGKSEGNALWLDKNKTSSYALYQYLINSDDTMVEHYLKVFTFLKPDEILAVMDEHNKEPHLRKAQKLLAKCIITDLHGEEEANKAEMMSTSLFTEEITKLSSEDILNNFKDMDKFTISEDVILEDLLVNSNICSSKREARELINGNAISLNNKKITDPKYLVTRENAIDKKVYLIKKGKKKYYLGIY